MLITFDQYTELKDRLSHYKAYFCVDGDNVTIVTHGYPDGTINDYGVISDYIEAHPELNIGILCCYPRRVAKFFLSFGYPNISERVLHRMYDKPIEIAYVGDKVQIGLMR